MTRRQFFKTSTLALAGIGAALLVKAESKHLGSDHAESDMIRDYCVANGFEYRYMEELQSHYMLKDFRHSACTVEFVQGATREQLQRYLTDQWLWLHYGIRGSLPWIFQPQEDRSFIYQRKNV